MLAILLCTGPLGLPLVWLSSRLSKLAKIGLTAGFVLLAVIFPIVLVWYWCEVAMRRHRQEVARTHLRLPKMRAKVPRAKLRELDKRFDITESRAQRTAPSRQGRLFDC